MSIMANYWAEKGWAVTLLTFDAGRERPFFEMHPQVNHVPLGVSGVSANSLHGALNNFKRVWVLRKALRRSKPDGVISFLDTVNVLTLLAAVGLRLPVIISERTDPAAWNIGKSWSLLRRAAYPFAAALVVQSQGVLAFFPQRVRRRAHVIPNPVLAPPNRAKPDRSSGGKQIVAMGRLGEEKGFDLLLRGFARIASGYPEWSLVIWGEGGQRGPLEALRDRLGLRERVALPGRTREPHDKLRQADLFVLPSRIEGFPNALGEAMACGLPVISFDCPSGPRELIRDQVDGLLVPAGDVAALAAAMERLMSNADERNRLAARAVEVSERFGLEKVMALWETILQKEKRNA